MTTDTDAGFRVVTRTTVYRLDGRSIDHGTVTHILTAEEVAAGRYKLEQPADAASRIARHRHMDEVKARMATRALATDTIGTITEKVEAL